MLLLVKFKFFARPLQWLLHPVIEPLPEPAQLPLSQRPQSVYLDINLVQIGPQIINKPLIWLLVDYYRTIAFVVFALWHFSLESCPTFLQRDLNFLHLDDILAFIDDASIRLLAGIINLVFQSLDDPAIFLLAVNVVILLYLHYTLQISRLFQLISIDVVVCFIEERPVLRHELDG